MKIRLVIIQYILILAVLAGVTPTSAEPLFDVHGRHMGKNGHYYLCDDDESDKIRITALNEEADAIKRFNVEIYTDLADVGNTSKAIGIFTNEKLSVAKYVVERNALNPDNIKTESKTYYVKFYPADGSEGSWLFDLTFDAIHINDVTPPKIEPYCAGHMPASVNTFITKHMSGNYHWYDSDGNALGMADFLTVGNLPEGEHLFKMQVKEGECYSLGIEMTLNVMGNSVPHLNKSYVNYVPSDISGGKYTKTFLEQALSQWGVELVDNPNNCDLIWKDSNGKTISNFNQYTPPVPTTYGVSIDQYTVQKDCGCGVSKATSVYLMRYVVPIPAVEDLEFCKDDPRAADGFDAIIGITTDATESKSNYILEFSKNPDMSDAVILEAGDEHFSHTFDVSEVGKKTYYIRQRQLSSGEYSEIVSFDVVVKQPTAPKLTDQKVCANTTKSVALSDVCDEKNLIWKDAENNTLTGSVSTVKRGDFTVSAQKYEIVNSEKCFSEISTATIHTDSLAVSISGDITLLPGQTGKAEISTIGSGMQTVIWSSSVKNTIVGDANKNEVNLKMGSSNITLTANVTDGVCTKTVNWTVQADLFQCPAPTADNITLCINDPRAANGFDADITLENKSDKKSNYTLSVSKNADMSDATTLAAGETHFDYSFDASTLGTQKVYIQQTELSRNLTSAIVPVSVKVRQPEIPSLKKAAICLNDKTEVKLSDLSSDSNLQWYDEDKNELSTTAKFNNKGTHPLYAKRYELVNGDKCWSELTSVNITADSIEVNVDGDNHLCPDSRGAVTLTGSPAKFDNIQWKSDVANSISNANSATVIVKMDNSDLNLGYTATSGVCKATGTWGISIGTGKVSGKIKFTEGEKIRESSSLKNVEFSSCGGTVSVEATIEHTSTDFTVKKGTKTLGTYTFAGDVAKFEIEGAGTYSVIYENDCETSFSFDVTKMNINPTTKTTKWSSCYGGYISAEISNVDGCKVVWKKDDVEVDKGTNTLRINNVSADNIGYYTYDLVCDGCPAFGVVSATNPDIYSPLTVTILQSADTICQGDKAEINLEISPNSSKVSYAWSSGNDIKANGASATVNPYITRDFHVIVSNGDCPQQTKTIKVNVQQQMSGNIEAGNIMCEGDSTTLDASSLEAERYEWKHTDSESPIITVVPNDVENKYTVTAYRGKCVVEKEFVLMVGATPKLASIDSIGRDDVEINMESYGDYQFIVDGKLDAKDVTDNVKMHVGFGTHTLSIIDIAGCKTDTSFIISTPPFEIQNFFVPGSDGENSKFRIPDAVIVYGNTTMDIYDRWGKKIVTLTSSDEDGWDGTYNGKQMPSTDYWYELNVDALDKTYFGHFTLIRE